MANYYELLKDPRWQRKRLEVMERDEFTCRWCFGSDETLNVHHTRYRKGAAPWEYEPNELLCVCETCHQKAKERQDRISAALGHLSPEQLERVLAYVLAVSSLSLTGPPAALDQIKEFPDIDVAIGIADVIGVRDWHTVWELVVAGEIDHERLREMWRAVRRRNA